MIVGTIRALGATAQTVQTKNRKAWYLGEFGRRNLVAIVEPAFLQFLVRLVNLALLFCEDVSGCREEDNCINWTAHRGRMNFGRQITENTNRINF